MDKNKYKDIEIYKNGKKKFADKSNWVSISNNLVYLSFGNSRLYFFYNKPENKKTIKDFHFDDKNQSLNFIWNGYWEKDLKKGVESTFVHDKYKIVFNKMKEYERVKKIVNLSIQNNKGKTKPIPIPKKSSRKIRKLSSKRGSRKGSKKSSRKGNKMGSRRGSK